MTGDTLSNSTNANSTNADATGLFNVANATTNGTILGRLRLVPDADIINPSNAFHQYADSGLDMVQAALIVSEPNIQANAESILFPVVALATKELTIEAVLDWVAFVRRREKRCAAVEPPAPDAE